MPTLQDAEGAEKTDSSPFIPLREEDRGRGVYE